MKTISIKQPWAHLICTPREDNPQLGIKDIENRTWPTKFRGRVLVHAAATEDKRWFDKCNESTASVVQHGITNSMTKDQYLKSMGCIIGSVEIVDCVINHESIWAEKFDGRLDSTTKRWIEKPIYNWVLANPVLLAKPIPAKGSLSFWDFPMTEDEYFKLEKIGNPTT